MMSVESMKTKVAEGDPTHAVNVNAEFLGLASALDAVIKAMIDVNPAYRSRIEFRLQEKFKDLERTAEEVERKLGTGASFGTAAMWVQMVLYEMKGYGA